MQIIINIVQTVSATENTEARTQQYSDLEKINNIYKNFIVKTTGGEFYPSNPSQGKKKSTDWIKFLQTEYPYF